MTTDEFAALPAVQEAVRKYERRPKWSVGEGDLARYGAGIVKALDDAGDLAALHAAMLLGGAADEAGAMMFSPEEAGAMARMLDDLRELRPVFERMATFPAPHVPRGIKPNLARQQLTLRLALAWVNADERLTITHDEASGKIGGRFVAAYLHAVAALPEDIRADPRSIDTDVRALRRQGFL